VKIDLGVHIDGYIVDTATTIDVDGTLEGFVAATDDALAEAIAMIEPGVNLGDVGRNIERIIKQYGLKTIKNLSGHSIKRYRLHAGKVVPNTKKRTSDVVEVGDCLAIEPYASTGTGMVKDTDFVYIMQNTGKEVGLDGTAEKLRVFLYDRYGPMPFSPRWIGATKGVDIVEALKELLRVKAIQGIPVQVERKARPVSQSEHTIFVSEDGVQVLTAPD
jgi:methionyl aminopeptidase